MLITNKTQQYYLGHNMYTNNYKKRKLLNLKGRGVFEISY